MGVTSTLWGTERGAVAGSLWPVEVLAFFPCFFLALCTHHPTPPPPGAHAQVVAIELGATARRRAVVVAASGCESIPSSDAASSSDRAATHTPPTPPTQARPARAQSMVCIRQATAEDLLQMQATNLWCLPENYQVTRRPPLKSHQFPVPHPPTQSLFPPPRPDEVLLLPHSFLAPATVRGGGPPVPDRGLRAGQDVRNSLV